MKAIYILKILLKILLTLILLNLAVNLSIAKEEQELRTELLKLSQVKEEMIAAGMGTTRIDDLITEGFIHFNNKNYEKTKEIVSSVYELRDAAFNIKEELKFVNQLYLDIRERNISLGDMSITKLEWDLGYVEREMEKENYEESLEILARVKKEFLDIIWKEYDYLNESVSVIEEKIGLLGLSKARITTLKSLLSEALETGKLKELEIIKQETMDLNKGLAYYEEIKPFIPVLESKNLSAQRIKDELTAAELELNFADYESSLSRLESLRTLAEKAILLDEEINELEKKIVDEKVKQGSNSYLKEAEIILKEAKHELIVGNYEGAEQKLVSARTNFESLKAEFLVERAGATSFGINLKEFVRKNWLYIVLVILVILLGLKLTSGAWSYGLGKKRIARLEKELKVNENMIQNLQKDYFVHKKMARESYDEAYESLQEKIMKIKDRLSQLNKKV
ncbi:hypothetical protein AYK26_03810 [Euryarchaeota archaeon SM23-78]|nr:MAG: hypothetical protein AYK26_03810 [Euryarchaeota archaeon SM23-78]MBW3001468.1 hypothetical protein [Candidatus Woesearchaeota archaeon]